MKISILIPTYNGECFLERSLEAIISNCILLKQENIGFELILSDDCSTDKTLNKARAILGGYKNLFDSLKIVRQPFNLGLYNNYRFLLNQASHEIVCFPAQDDKWEYQKILLEYRLLIKTNSVCSYSYANIFHEGSLQPFKSEIFPKAGSGKTARDRFMNTFIIRGSNPIHGLFLRKALLSIDSFPQKQGGDMITLCLLAAEGDFICTKKFLFSKYEPLDKNDKNLHLAKISKKSPIANIPIVKLFVFVFAILEIRLRIRTAFLLTLRDIIFLMKSYSPSVVNSVAASIRGLFLTSKKSH